VALDREDARRVVQLLTDILSNAFRASATAASCVFGLDALTGAGRALADVTVPSPRSASTTERRSTLAFIERFSASADVEAPGLRQAATASALNSAL
jgi:hypothetical protein